ncbi:MAG: hypothetical protein PeribacterA2_0197 [Candidatus Peribacter riflensis]|uniref:Uncharacterized protein n=1 Tax=Candidatus Peribacter riflensis TaxID=1735162 RepID=A0A0S1SK62_9BACT|nr:MAG: hypothetical protein PeribacterA2_0197 [Candidatus Peribacter riflensis]ALM10693.1 MAG: hypothetical protein PeribacterB2_0197 [Candidatus Peribacter riflensis]ALM11795.1 MAG: hypothetical protein PeribacterC2_0196 [Candidatus Peribacter riflensis]ALM12898.1 MAG: hypothetical protein PeribacterD1_0197 [Candidatus Peribacter riflensis]ALM13999.1 MAG: hypothetical protein PeribacterD2_0197 [Candidatus Peribacter riflensis]
MDLEALEGSHSFNTFPSLLSTNGGEGRVRWHLGKHNIQEDALFFAVK